MPAKYWKMLQIFLSLSPESNQMLVQWSQSQTYEAKIILLFLHLIFIYLQFWCLLLICPETWVSFFLFEFHPFSWPEVCWLRAVYNRDHKHCRLAPHHCSSSRAWSGWCHSWCSTAPVSWRRARTWRTWSTGSPPETIIILRKLFLSKVNMIMRISLCLHSRWWMLRERVGVCYCLLEITTRNGRW